MFRSIFFFCFKNKKVFEDDPNLSNSQNEDNQDENGEWHQKKLKNNFVLGKINTMNLQELGICTKNEEDYKLWAISCAEEIRQENIERAKLKEACYEESGKKVVEKRINYWNYLRKAIQIVDLQNGIIENQNQKLTVKLEEKNQLYHTEREKTDKLYKYISLLEEPVAESIKVVELGREIKDMLTKYDKVARELEEKTRTAEERKEEY